MIMPKVDRKDKLYPNDLHDGLKCAVVKMSRAIHFAHFRQMIVGASHVMVYTEDQLQNMCKTEGSTELAKKRALGCVIPPAGAVARSRNLGQTFLANLYAV